MNPIIKTVRELSENWKPIKDGYKKGVSMTKEQCDKHTKLLCVLMLQAIIMLEAEKDEV